MCQNIHIFRICPLLSELCRGLAISEKWKIYNLIDRLIRLVLTLPVSTATIERAFSAMKLVKTRLRSRMEDESLADHLVVYIEKEIAKDFPIKIIMDEFYSMEDSTLSTIRRRCEVIFWIFFVHVYSKLDRFYIQKKSYF
jgi:hypothetical protein